MCTEEAVREILTLVADQRRQFVLPVNVDVLVKFREAPSDVEFQSACRAAQVVLADGMPIVWASRLLRRPLPGRVAGVDLLGALCVEMARTGRTGFFLGAGPGIAARAAEAISRRAPRFRLAGVHSPPLGFEHDSALNRIAVEAVNRAAPDFLFVALGPPRAEKWIHAHLPILNVGVAMPVGGSFDILAGVVGRAPRLMRETGLEWVWRLGHEPARLWRRYLSGAVQFLRLFRDEWGRVR